MRKILIVTTLVLGGCVASDTPAPPPPAPAPFEDTANYVPVRDFLYGSAALSTTVQADRPRAYVLLDRDEKKDSGRLCEAFMDLPTGKGIINPNVKVVTTWWLTKEETAEDRSCKQLVDSFDYAKATSVRTSYGLGADGIYILAVDQNHHAFWINLTDASKKQMRNTVLLWLQTAAEQAPEAPGLAITSDSFWDRLKRKFCGAGGGSQSAAVNAAAGALAAGVTVVGTVAVVGKEVVCEALA